MKTGGGQQIPPLAVGTPPDIFPLVRGVLECPVVSEYVLCTPWSPDPEQWTVSTGSIAWDEPLNLLRELGDTFDATTFPMLLAAVPPDCQAVFAHSGSLLFARQGAGGQYTSVAAGLRALATHRRPVLPDLPGIPC
jgi:hypothetical protein